MDARGNIYAGENVLVEDAARLDGYLRGRAEAALLEAEKEKARLVAEAAETDLDFREGK